eukprot:82673_1
MELIGYNIIQMSTPAKPPSRSHYVQCSLCNEVRQYRSIPSHWSVALHPRDVQGDARYHILNDPNDPYSGIYESESSDESASTSTSTTVLDRILKDETLKIDVVLEMLDDEEPEFSASDNDETQDWQDESDEDVLDSEIRASLI